MTTFRRDPNDKTRDDGECDYCGAVRTRMGWSNDPGRYWLLCTASQMNASREDAYGRCNLPTEEMAKKRLGIK